jgi:hypothetical protein
MIRVLTMGLPAKRYSMKARLKIYAGVGSKSEAVDSVG